jgi:hypothetical protein
MRPGPATQTAFARSFLLPYHRKAADDRLGPTALDQISSAAFAKASCKSVILRSRTDNRTVSQRSCLLPAPKAKEQIGGGGRNARATSSTRLRAFLDFPPAIHPRESPAAAGSAAIIRQCQETSRFDASQFQAAHRVSQYKNEPPL